MPDPRPPTAPAPFHVIAKPTGPICNLDCECCFFLSKEALYPGDRFRMADVLMETHVRQLLEPQRDLPEVTVARQGGEPTLMGVEGTVFVSHFDAALAVPAVMRSRSEAAPTPP
jgi:uncharacterized protein